MGHFMTTPISIIIPTYNRSGACLRAVDSVLNQSFKDFELILVDDGSTDHTQKWISSYTDKRLEYFKTGHQGVAHARNFGVQKAKGEWICFLDSDDVWRRHKLSEQVRFHMAHPKILISQTDDVWIRNARRVNKMKKHEFREGNLFKESLKLCLICCSSVMLKKSLFWEVGGFDESLPTCEDYDLWLKITAHHDVGFVQKPLVTKFGGHADQLSKKFKVMDSFRTQSLQKILDLGILTPEQREWTLAELERKKTIMKQGLAKRTL